MNAERVVYIDFNIEAVDAQQAFVLAGEVATRRLSAVRLRGLGVRRHFHVIQNETRTLTASGQAFMALLEHAGRRLPPATRSAARVSP